MSESEVTSVRTMFGVRVVAQPMVDGTYTCTILQPMYKNPSHEFVMACEKFSIDSTLRPVFSFSERCPEPCIGELMPYVQPRQTKRDRGFTGRMSPTGYGKDYIEFRRDGDNVAWLRSELWEEMDSSAVEEYGKYCVSSGSLNIYSREAVAGLSYSGWDIDKDGNIFQPYDGEIIAAVDSTYFEYVLAECAVGASGRDAGGVWDGSGNNHADLIEAAKRAVAR